jgi:uncharacterized protein
MIASPCINVCKMDEQTGLCSGCLRTIDEIARWSSIDDSRRLSILAAIAKRRQEHDPWEGDLRCDCDRHG